ncbi:CRISPR-associated endonuclease Cas1 [bacterium]|nr:CRISPR-associated endonuclease Cas1 [bacterium]
MPSDNPYLDVPPIQYNLLTGEEEIPTVRVESLPADDLSYNLEDGITVVQSPSGLTASISGNGCHVGKRSERLVIRKKDGRAVWQIPMARLHEVILDARGLSITTDLLTALAERGIRTSIIAFNGKPVAEIASPLLTAVVETRKAQFEALKNGRGLRLAKAVVAGKIRNQQRLLKYFGKYISTSQPDLFSSLQEDISAMDDAQKGIEQVAETTLDETRARLMGIEGRAGQRYWSAVGRIIGGRAPFPGRTHRGASDPVNVMLNFGYGVLYSQVWGAVHFAGLEPFAGFLHTDRAGKPSLVFDMVEEFRAPVVDRTVISMAQLGQVRALKTPGMLDGVLKTEFLSKLLERIDGTESFDGGKYRIRSIIQKQCRLAASFIRGSVEEYRPFRFKW